MWCETLKNGKYRFAERYYDPLTGAQKKVSLTMDKNTRQAQKIAQEALYEKIQGKLMPQEKKISLKDLVELYREDQKRTIKQSTWRRNYFACETLKNILGADTLVNKLTSGYIRKQFLATGKNGGTLNEHLKRLKALLRWAYKNDYLLDISYLDKLERFQDIPHKQKIQDKFLEGEELRILLQHMSINKWRTLTSFLALSGLRFGEAAALLRTDVDLKNRIIHVAKTYDGANDIVTPPKTFTSTRSVYMQDELYNLCKHILSVSYIQTKVIPINSSNLLFPDANGKHISFDVYSKYLRENSEKVLGRRITPHTLRHTHASLMLEAGMDVDAISARLGHADSKITKEIYLHVTEKLKEKQNNQIKEIKILAP